MGLSTIFRHIGNAGTDTCRRSKSNLSNQGVSVFEFRRRCEAEGFYFAQLDDDVYAIKTTGAFEDFKRQHPNARFQRPR